MQADFYVSTEGDDAWSGKLAGDDADGEGGPFATLERARQAVCELRRVGLRDYSLAGRQVKEAGRRGGMQRGGTATIIALTGIFAPDDLCARGGRSG